MTVVRWSLENNMYIPSGATFFANALLGLSGFINVILLMTTKPESGLFGQLMFQPPSAPPSIIEMGVGVEMEREQNLARLPSR